MNRFDLQKMAEERVADTAALLDAGRFQAAYYLCGYAVECALKACIARQVREFDFPDRKVVNDSYVHNLTKLLIVSGIDQLKDEEAGQNRAFASNWGIVKRLVGGEPVRSGNHRDRSIGLLSRSH